MNVFEKVRSELSKTSKEKIVKELGYHSMQGGLKAIDAFLGCDSLHSWITISGHFDFRYGSVELFERLAAIFAIEGDAIQRAIREVEIVAKEFRRCGDAFILAKIPKEHLHISSMGSAYSYAWRRKTIAPDLLAFKNLEDILEEVSSIIKEHHQHAKKAKRRSVEHIEGYEYHHYEGSVYYFTKTGTTA